MCSSDVAAKPITSRAGSSPHGTPTGYWTTAKPVLRIVACASLVPCGNAIPFPRYVEMIASRSRIAPMYSGVT
jgi:hypothetical protein